MIILHAGYSNGYLLLWGERPLEDAPSTHQKGRRRRAPQALPAVGKPYPYDAGQGVGEALRDRLALAAGNRRGAVAWLPTRANTPVPSSPLIASIDDSRGKLRLSPWTVMVYPLSVAEAVYLLCTCPSKRMLGPGVIVGPDLAYWAESLRCAGSMIARQQYLPGLGVVNNEYRAVWQPLWLGDDANHLSELARRMPAIGRALTEPGAAAPPETPAIAILKQFISGSVDYLIRSSTSEESRRVPGSGRPKSSFNSVHDAWLHGLQSHDNVVQGDQAELARLALQIREWHRPIAVAANSPFRMCLRLEEPETAEDSHTRTRKVPPDRWYLRYLLQPHDDPSLLIPAEDAWKTRGRKVSLLQRRGGNVREYLLLSLGQAAGICPAIAASLETANPGGYSWIPRGPTSFSLKKPPDWSRRVLE